MRPVKRKVLPPQPMTPEQALAHMKRKKFDPNKLVNARMDKQRQEFVKRQKFNANISI